MSKKRLPDHQIQEILKGLFIDKLPKTKIAQEVLGRKSRESTIRNIERVYNKHGNYFGVTLGGDINDDEDFTVPDSTLESLCEHPDWNVSNLAKRLRTAQRSNNQLRKIQREMFDSEGVEPLDFNKIIGDAVKLQKDKLQLDIKVPEVVTKKTVEILYSDLQIGKVSESWNTEIAKRAMKYYGAEVLKIVKDTNPEKILFCSLGDIIECAHKHKQQSAYSTDSSNAEQLANAIHGMWWDILKPLMELGIPMEIIGVAGNHGADSQSGFDMFKSGRYCYDWTIYSALKDMTEIAGADHVTWNIPEGVFATAEIYGDLTVYEHGYLCKGPSENAMLTLKHKRSTNLQKFVNRLIIGDMHHECNYDNGRMQVNGAFFGVAFEGIEYSGIAGFHAVPVQLVNIHEPTTGVGQNTCVETKTIQIAKGYNCGL
ncbi:coil containing protein [Vibrio phage 1.170.O._10N.261.52.C3]|nr:coil containing protein [Vibrio phage 1.170.O._10N.261.52.C3]